MNKSFTSVGCFFISIAAFLYASKHITAAIMSSYINTPQVTYFEGAHTLIGSGMTFWIVASLLVGLVFFVVGIAPAVRRLFQVKGIKTPMNKDLR